MPYHLIRVRESDPTIDSNEVLGPERTVIGYVNGDIDEARKVAATPEIVALLCQRDVVVFSQDRDAMRAEQPPLVLRPLREAKAAVAETSGEVPA